MISKGDYYGRNPVVFFLPHMSAVEAEEIAVFS